VRVISRFHDYYDGVQGLGQDRSLVYVREQRALSPEEKAQYLCEMPGRGYSGRYTGFESWPFWVAVAGRRYRGFAVRTIPVTETSCAEFFYSAESYAEHVLRVAGFDPFAPRSKTYGHRVRAWQKEASRRSREAVVGWFNAQGSPEVAAPMAALGHVAVGCAGWSEPIRSIAPLVLNPRLADYDFFKVLDPYQCFQEVSMWIGGVLPGRDAMMAKVSDADRFVEHGFDAKTSFRGRNR
jgi:hypothetical protein